MISNKKCILFQAYSISVEVLIERTQKEYIPACLTYPSGKMLAQPLEIPRRNMATDVSILDISL